MRVLCSATGSDPGSSRVTCEARAQRGVQPLGHAGEVQSCAVASTYTCSGGTIGSPSATTQWRPSRGVARQDRADRLRVDVHGLHAQHVVAPAVDPDARRAAPARARRGPHAAEVARAVAQQRRGLAAQVRPHELAARAVLELAAARRCPGRPARAGRARRRSDAAPRPRRTRPPIVDQTSLMPKRVGHAGAPGRLDLGAHGRQARAGLARGHDVAQRPARAAPCPPRALGRRGRRETRACRRSR